jgi:glyoxylase-like metal-dependent hydrolase (beta-lactamase superfamily II)
MGDAQTLDLPGSPTAIHTPGHTSGSCSLHLASIGVLFTGDALVTYEPYTQERGPRTMNATVNEDNERALASLDALEGIEAAVVLPGRAEPWTSGAVDAVRQARALASAR